MIILLKKVIQKNIKKYSKIFYIFFNSFYIIKHINGNLKEVIGMLMNLKKL